MKTKTGKRKEFFPNPGTGKSFYTAKDDLIELVISALGIIASIIIMVFVLLKSHESQLAWALQEKVITGENILGFLGFCIGLILCLQIIAFFKKLYEFKKRTRNKKTLEGKNEKGCKEKEL